MGFPKFPWDRLEVVWCILNALFLGSGKRCVQGGSGFGNPDYIWKGKEIQNVGYLDNPKECTLGISKLNEFQAYFTGRPGCMHAL